MVILIRREAERHTGSSSAVGRPVGLGVGHLTDTMSRTCWPSVTSPLRSEFWYPRLRSIELEGSGWSESDCLGDSLQFLDQSFLPRFDLPFRRINVKEIRSVDLRKLDLLAPSAEAIPS